MKRIFALASLLALFSCSTAYQQIVSLGSPELKLTDDGRFTYDVDDFVINYNFWAAGGKVSFILTNNSAEDVFVDLSRSFLVVNGMTFDYYQNRNWSSNAVHTVTTSSSYGTSTTISNALATATGTSFSSSDYAFASANGSASGSSRTHSLSSRRTETSTVNHGVVITEKEGVWVPAHSSRSFNEFSLFDVPFRKCGFARNPSKKENMVLTFTESNTPYVFENMIMLLVGNEDRRIVNTFYIESLTNIQYDQTYEEIDAKDCDDVSTGEKIRIYKFSSPNRFYINYNLESEMNSSEMDRVKKSKASNSQAEKKDSKKKSSFGKKNNDKSFDDGLY